MGEDMYRHAFLTTECLALQNKDIMHENGQLIAN